MNNPSRTICLFLAGVLTAGSIAVAQEADAAAGRLVCVPQDGYRGLWAAGPEVEGKYGYLWAGGRATGPAQAMPIAIHAPQVGRTFFVYAGESAEQGGPQLLISWFEHKDGTVPRPRLLPPNPAGQPAACGSLAIDGKGTIWVFQGSVAGGEGRILRSSKPHDIDTFEIAAEFPMIAPQPWCLEDGTMALAYTEPGEQGGLAFRSSTDGTKWSEPRILARIGTGCDHLSGCFQNKLGVMFNYRPDATTDSPTNLYYIESTDGGKTWQTATKQPLQLPLSEAQNPALVKDYQAIGRLAFLSDFFLDARGNAVLAFIMSKSARPGPSTPPRKWTTARWTGREWETGGDLRTLSNYDCGALHIEPGNVWRFITPTAPAAPPQRFAPGNEIVDSISHNQGRMWKPRLLTNKSQFNHNYVRRPVNAVGEFYVLWCDGDGTKPSASRLYFADKDYNVFQLPTEMNSDSQKPAPVQLVLDSPAGTRHPHTQPASAPQ